MMMLEIKVKSRFKAMNHEMVFGLPSPVSIYSFLNTVLNAFNLMENNKITYDEYYKDKFYYLVRECKLVKDANNSPVQKRSVFRLENKARAKTILDTPIGFIDASIFVKWNYEEELNSEEKEMIKKRVRFLGNLPKELKLYFHKQHSDENEEAFIRRVLKKSGGKLVYPEPIKNKGKLILDEIIDKTFNEAEIYPSTIGYRVITETNSPLKNKHFFVEPLLGLINIKSVYQLNTDDFKNKSFQLKEKADIIYFS